MVSVDSSSSLSYVYRYYNLESLLKFPGLLFSTGKFKELKLNLRNINKLVHSAIGIKIFASMGIREKLDDNDGNENVRNKQTIKQKQNNNKKKHDTAMDE